MKAHHDSSVDLSDLLKPHVGLLIWIIFLGFGGGVLALYYADINYLPEIAWDASLTFLGVISIIGGTIVVILSLLLFFPGFIWCRFFICDKRLAKLFYMQDEGVRQGEQASLGSGPPGAPAEDPSALMRVSEMSFSYESGTSEPGLKAQFVARPQGEEGQDKEISETCILQIIVYIGMPFFILILLVHLFLLVHEYLQFSKPWIFFILFSAMLLGIGFWYIRRSFRKVLQEMWEIESPPSESPPSESPRFTSRLFKYAFWFDVSVIISFAAMFLIYTIAERGQVPEEYIPLAIGCVLIVFFSNCAVAVLYSKYSARAIAVSIIAATLLLFVADFSSSLANKVVEQYGFGGEPSVTVVVDKDGCMMLERLDITAGPCEPYGQLDEVKMLSRLGSEYFFERIQSLAPDSVTTRFVLPKENVVSWSVVVEEKVNKEEGSDE